MQYICCYTKLQLGTQRTYLSSSSNLGRHSLLSCKFLVFKVRFDKFRVMRQVSPIVSCKNARNLKGINLLNHTIINCVVDGINEQLLLLGNRVILSQAGQEKATVEVRRIVLFVCFTLSDNFIIIIQQCLVIVHEYWVMIY